MKLRQYGVVCSMVAMVVLLGACGEKKKPQPATLACADPAVAKSIQNSLQQFLKEQARQFASNDSRQFVDADKIIAALSDVQVNVENATQVSGSTSAVCQADLNIRIPSSILQTAETNAPLLYGETGFNDIIRQRLTGSSLTYNGSGVFSQSFQYTPQKNADGNMTLSYMDNSLPTVTNALSAALLPYGVKDIVMINGKPVAREDALKGNVDNKEPEKVEIDTPEEPEQKNVREEVVSVNELELTRIENRALDNDINALWQKLDPAIQQELLNEQRAWIQEKSSICSQAAAASDNALQAEYLQLQCDSRFTRERLRYLRDYSI